MVWEVMMNALNCRASRPSFVIDTWVSSATVFLYFTKRKTNLRQNVAYFSKGLEKALGAPGMYVSNPPPGSGRWVVWYLQIS
jgi:hypothetical protein